MTNRRNRERERINKEALGKVADFILDLIKLIFAGVILVGIIDMSVNTMLLVIVGSVISVILFALWYVVFIRSKRKG